ncbi:MAG: motility associated factor glycosyltransferase family protein [Lachnospiraceae bacterium]|nr:motility associated factor glycosyltransferase family protein [Lachnospiraceae bacterium]
MNKNYKIITERYPKVADAYLKVKDIDFSENSIRAFVDSAADGKDIVTFSANGRYNYVNSRYYPGEAASVWAEMFENYDTRGLVAVLGLGNGMHIREMLKKLSPSNAVVIVEPSLEMFNIVMNEFDISDIISDRRVFLAVDGVSDGIYNEFLGVFLNYSNYELLDIYALPNYDRIFRDRFAELMNMYKSAAELIVVERNTKIKYSGEYITNILNNYEDIINNYTINELKDKFKDVDISNVPAIIVSAGPSLDDNINELKAAQGKAFIIVVDTAIKTVLNAGIMPDMSVIVDPHKPMVLFNHPDIAKIPMVAYHRASSKITEKIKAPKFYFGEPNQYISHIYKKYAKIDVDCLETGGSVANNAFSIAKDLGFETIILVGQDLAFKENRTFTKDAYGKNVDKEKMKEKQETVWVDGVNGEKVETLKNLELYLRWFEKQIVVYKELRVIDATEGGALIKGAINMTLKEAIDNECKKEFNASEVIAKCMPAFNEADILKIKEEFNNIPSRLNELKKLMEEGIRSYYKIDELYRKGKRNSNEFTKYLNRISELDLEITNEPLYELIEVHNAKVSFEMKRQAYEKAENEQDEMKMLVNNGTKLFESYKQSINKLMEDVTKWLENTNSK